jgi:hypothetical protein
MGTREEIQSRMARDTELSKERQANAKRTMDKRRASQARAKKLKALADPDSRQYHKGKKVDTAKYSNRAPEGHRVKPGARVQKSRLRGTGFDRRSRGVRDSEGRRVTDKMSRGGPTKTERRKTPRTGQRHAALDKARTQGRIQPRPPGHPNYQGAGPRAPKNTVAKSLTKGKGLRDLANSFSWRAGDMARKASQTGVGKALTKFAGSGAGRVAAKLATRVAGPAIAVGIVTDAYAITHAAIEGGRAIAAQSQARNEKQGSEAKYGTVEAATRTRHARRDARRKAAAVRAGNKVNV